MRDTSLRTDRGGEAVTTDVKEEATEIAEEQAEKSFFARGALLGLFGGALAAILLISVGGSVVSLFDDVFGSGEEVAAAPAEELTGEALLISTGSNLATTSGCIGCHSTNGLDGTGPTWQGLGATVDDEYLRRAIVDPNADIAPGFEPDVMPATYADSLSSEEVDALVAYIKSL